jgi:hypothetical protein
MRYGAGYLWSEGQWAALALLASTLLGRLIPDAPTVLVSALPSALTLMLAFPLIVMVPVLFAAGARTSWRARSAWAGLLVGLHISGVTTSIVVAMYVIGLAIGQPQLLRIGLGWESLRDVGLMLGSTIGLGTALSALGALGGALVRLARRGADVSLSR